MYQQTLKGAVHTTGVGLHTGAQVTLALRPAPADSGIVFTRTDCNPPLHVPAHALSVSDTNLATTLAKDGVKIATVEHLMSALAGLGIHNAFVDVDGPELPIMDGSAAPFVFLIQSAGVETLPAPCRFLRIKQRVQVDDGDVTASLSPWDGFKVTYTLQYEHPVFRRHAHFASVLVTPAAYVNEVSRARTFGFLADFEKLRAMNLARGGSLDNAVVVDDEGILNKGGLRQEDEFVKHKILDAIGDLYLFGLPLLGHFEGFKSGHSINNRLVRRVLSDSDCFEIVTLERPSSAPTVRAGATVSGG